MELYLDTADISAVKRLSRILPLQGVTTNPSIIAKARTSLWEVLPALRDALGGEGKLFAQVGRGGIAALPCSGAGRQSAGHRRRAGGDQNSAYP